MKHRVRRLPDTPERIARGIWVGVFTTFTPFYGLHFVAAILLARVFNGNALAALLATFFGNPLTYIPIGLVSLQTGHFILGNRAENMESTRSFGGKFLDAWRDLRDNLLAGYSGEEVDWTNLMTFYNEIFFPYMVGGIFPGVVTGAVGYYLSVPIIRAYQKRRKGALREKLIALRKKALKSDDETHRPH